MAVKRKKTRKRTTLFTAPDEGYTSVTFKVSWKLWKQLKIDAMNHHRSMAKQLNWVLTDVYKYPVYLKNDPLANDIDDE